MIIHIPGKLFAGPDTLSRIPRHPGPKSGGAWVSVTDKTLAPDLGPTLDGALQEEEEQLMNCKEARIHMMYALRLAAEPTNTKPDTDLDVSDAMLASMEFGIRSIT